MQAPQGIEKVLALAALSPQWRAKVLADPLAAAREAGIGLSESETSILAATPRTALEQMADSLAKRPGGVPWGKIIRGTVACAAVTGLAGTCLVSSASGGIRGDLPRPRLTQPTDDSEAPAVLWLASLDDALTQAREDRLAVMAVFPHPQPGTMVPNDHPWSAGIAPDFPRPLVEERAQRIVLADSGAFRSAVKTSDLLSTKVNAPVDPPDSASQETQDRYAQAVTDWLAARRKCRLLGTDSEEVSRATAAQRRTGRYVEEQNRLPAVVFLAPNGAILAQVLQPQDEPQLIDSIKAVPALLSRWFDEHPEFVRKGE